MIILSIHPGHNATAGLIVDGQVIGLLSQEKIDNIKNSAQFPLPAAEALLAECDLSWDQIQEIVVAGNDVFPSNCYDYLFVKKSSDHQNRPIINAAKKLESSFAGRMVPYLFDMARDVRKQELLKEGRKELLDKLAESPLRNKPITFVDHHQCHAFSAYYGLSTNDEPALIFTADGSGDNACATVSVARNGIVERIALTPPYASLDGVYSNTTRFLGMKILEHEYKVMGLAPYCKGYEKQTFERIFARTIDLDPDNPLVFKSAIDASKFYEYLAQNAIGERFDNIAGAVQLLLEDRITRWIREGIKATGIRNIFTGGGVFMNVKLNMKIQELEEVERVSFLPSSGDESNPIGAGFNLAIQRGNQPKPLKNLYLGISFSKDRLADFIEKNRIWERFEVTEPEDIEDSIANLLSEKQIVARFSGRCEWGARSLGNRAILAHPSFMESFYTVNDLIKARDFWMPFAPSVLDTFAFKYLENYQPEKATAYFMITAFKATRLGIDHLRAAMHQGDHTIRPQVVTESANPDYYRLIQIFARKTGVGAVMNTSFNLHGYPLVATPDQAIMTFENSGLENLALGPFLIQKVK